MASLEREVTIANPITKIPSLRRFLGFISRQASRGSPGRESQEPQNAAVNVTVGHMTVHEAIMAAAAAARFEALESGKDEPDGECGWEPKTGTSYTTAPHRET